MSAKMATKARKAAKSVDIKQIVAQLSSPGLGSLSISPDTVSRIRVQLRPSMSAKTKQLATKALPRLIYNNPAVPVQVELLPRRKRNEDGKLVIAEGPQAGQADESTMGIEVEYKNMPSRRIGFGKKKPSEILKELGSITRAG